MSNVSARFALPLLEAGQAQKEILHNEALIMLEALVQPVALSQGDNAPPDTPQEGASWIVGTSPGGAWAGQADTIATWTAGGWRFAAPQDGMAIWVADQHVPARYSDGAWHVGAVAAKTLVIAGEQVVGSRQAAIDPPTGGATVDAQARMTIGAVLDALRIHGLIESA